MKATGLILAVPGLVLTSLFNFGAEPPTKESSPVQSGIPLDRISPLPRDVRAVLAAMDRGETVDGIDLEGRTTLMWAAQNGHVEIAKRLLEKGADVEARDWWGRSALSMALENGHREIVTLLVDHQAGLSNQTIRAKSPPLPG